MKFVLVIAIAVMPLSALAAQQKTNQVPKKATSSVRQTKDNSLGTRPAQGVGAAIGGSKAVGGN